jgi:membrane protein YdbS with pleckstrin-like domain
MSNLGDKMDANLQQALQGGKASPKMRTIWMLKWAARYIFTIMFIMFLIGFEIFLDILGFNLLNILLICVILPIALGFLISFLWASLYWDKYTFILGEERIVITRGVIGKRVTNIPYERIQNVNVWRGVLDRIFGLYAIQIETAGSFNIRGTGGYGSQMVAEGSIQGLTNPEPISEYILEKAKGRSGLGDEAPKREITKDERIRLLEERFAKGQISEKTYEDLKRKYEQQ